MDCIAFDRFTFRQDCSTMPKLQVELRGSCYTVIATGLASWRHIEHRTVLQCISLLTGNFTGRFRYYDAISFRNGTGNYFGKTGSFGERTGKLISQARSSSIEFFVAAAFANVCWCSNSRQSRISLECS
jgi:hypothetical protein